MQYTRTARLPAPARSASRLFRRLALVVLVVFIAPALACAAWWASADRPQNWREADWSATGILPDPSEAPEAAIYVMAARTGGMKGAFATHSWIVTKAEGDAGYDRYDKVGWGRPIRHNSRPADGRWYSNVPEIVGRVEGDEAARLIPKIEAAIEAYPFDGTTEENGYRIYPGPNSNTFVAHVLHQIPELGLVLPPNAIGRDYRPPSRAVTIDGDWRNVHVSLYGLAGFAFGMRSGIEVHFMGLVAGIDFARLGLKIPAFGLVSLF